MTTEKTIIPNSPAGKCLRAMAENRYGLYLTPNKGYSASGHKPFYNGKTIQQLVDRNLAWLDGTGGAHGSAKVTRAGKDLATRVARARDNSAIAYSVKANAEPEAA